MSEQAIVEIITRALAEAGFRSRLFAEPAVALAGYDLSEEERALLSGLRAEALDSFASQVEERVSKATPQPIPLPMQEDVSLPISEAEMQNLAEAVRSVLPSLNLRTRG